MCELENAGVVRLCHKITLNKEVEAVSTFHQKGKSTVFIYTAFTF